MDPVAAVGASVGGNGGSGAAGTSQTATRPPVLSLSDLAGPAAGGRTTRLDK
jgi:hypothetical protein